MKKKIYHQPVMDVIAVEITKMICASGEEGPDVKGSTGNPDDLLSRDWDDEDDDF